MALIHNITGEYYAVEFDESDKGFIKPLIDIKCYPSKEVRLSNENEFIYTHLDRSTLEFDIREILTNYQYDNAKSFIDNYKTCIYNTLKTLDKFKDFIDD